MSEKDTNNSGIKRGPGRKMTWGDKIKCALLVVGVLLFCVWMLSGWPLVLLPFIVDAYWTHYIPWDWWRSIKNGFLRQVMSWVDAIVFAIVAVWVLQNFFFQNFQIPTTSLEKSMLAGDYLLVSKYHYGPRVPMTPLSLPVFQHTISFFGHDLGKSYLEHPQVAYDRMPGLRQVKRNDIVVFNYPKGDSIMEKFPTQDYYQAKEQLMGVQGMTEAQFERNVGRVFCRPVDRRENYVKRCIGLPGETLQIVDRQVFIDGKPLDNPVEMQQLYLVYTSSPVSVITTTFWKNLGVYTKGGPNVNPDVYEITGNELAYVAQVLGFEPDSVSGKFNHLYQVNLTAAKAEKVAQKKEVSWIITMPGELEGYYGIFPHSPLFSWKASNFGPLWIPKKGAQITLSPENEALYGRCIRVYEGNTLTSDAEGNYYVNGEKTSTYQFRMDYYWMMGDNRDNSADSRFWGFVPEDHIVGTPLFIWISIDPESGDWRWDRLFKGVLNI